MQRPKILRFTTSPALVAPLGLVRLGAIYGITVAYMLLKGMLQLHLKVFNFCFRLENIVGIGSDSIGNIYVGMSLLGASIRCFTFTSPP